MTTHKVKQSPATTTLKAIMTLCLLLTLCIHGTAQKHFRLSDEQLRIDSVLPVFSFVKELGENYADSTYNVSIENPQYVRMKRREARRYKKLTGKAMPEWPTIETYTGVSRRKGSLYATFVPMVRRDGKNLKLSSFCLKVETTKKEAEASTTLVSHSPLKAVDNGSRYARHSALASGKWVKISVPATGIYHLSDSLLKEAGFSNPQNVRVYGYGGEDQPEQLTPEYLSATDDLPPVPMAMVGERRLFRAVGPVNWPASSSTVRTRNPYSDAGYYFLTESDSPETALMDSAAFVSYASQQPEYFHALHEDDEYAWYHGGRNLYEAATFAKDVPRTFALPSNGRTSGRLTVSMSYSNYCDASVAIGSTVIGNITVNRSTTAGVNAKSFPDKYSKGAADVWTFPVSDMPAADSVYVTITQTSGSIMRLDRIEMCYDQPLPVETILGGKLPQPAIAGHVACQDHHADAKADMVIIIPESGLLEGQAQRLANLHQSLDGLSVRVVKANELYNEFSSGTPHANAYRRYMKMLYDRAESEEDMPRHLLLLGDAVFDNRMRTSNFTLLHPSDLLLCYESENSFSETACYVTDDYFAMLDDNEGADLLKKDKSDIAVGRLPARTVEEAATMVDKLYYYTENDNAGSWQNNICLMGDDGNANMHMNDAESIAAIIENNWPDYELTKIYWDAYERKDVARGHSYPDVTRLILEKMRDGALIMNYSGHGSAITLSHEYVVNLSDFQQAAQKHLPLWFTASCDVAPFDGYNANIGEQAMFNPTGGAIAFIGTTRTVYATHNRAMNKSLTSYVLSLDSDGKAMPIGEALRRAKNDQVNGSSTSQQAGINKFHFSLLGDPALRLPLPTAKVVIDSVNGISAGTDTLHLLAGDSVTVSGHIEGHPDMEGVATLTVKDALQTITCRMNPLDKAEMPSKPLVYNDRPGTLFCGSDSIRGGCFTITFAVPKDISYSESTGLMLVHAIDLQRNTVAHGSFGEFTMGSADGYSDEGIGPAIIAWLDTPQFTNGGITGREPLLHADIYDPDGVNASGNGIGHGIELAIDGMTTLTYTLNSYFRYTFGDFKGGTLEFRLPQLDDGQHQLTLRAWDVLNYSSVATIDFIVGTTGNTQGISDTTADSTAGAETFDLQGRRATNSGSRLGTLLLKRSKDGRVKKMLQRKQ